MTEYILSIFAYRKKRKKIRGIPPHHLVIVVPTKIFLGIPIRWEAFYCPDNIGHLPQTRSIQIDAFLKQEADMNIDRNTLEFAIDKLIGCLDPSEGSVKIGDANLILMELKKRLAMVTLPEHIYRVAALCFFKNKEDLEGFLTPNEIERRAELLKKKIPLEELLGESMSSILKILNYSKKDFQSFFHLRAMEQQLIADAQRIIFTS